MSSRCPSWGVRTSAENLRAAVCLPSACDGCAVLCDQVVCLRRLFEVVGRRREQ